MSCIKLWLIFFKEIDSIDVQTGRVDKFGKGFQQKIYLKEIHELFFFQVKETIVKEYLLSIVAFVRNMKNAFTKKTKKFPY